MFPVPSPECRNLLAARPSASRASERGHAPGAARRLGAFLPAAMISSSRLHANTKKAHKKFKTAKVEPEDPKKKAAKQGNYLAGALPGEGHRERHPGQVSIMARDFRKTGSRKGMPKELEPSLTREEWAAHFRALDSTLKRNKRMLCCGRAEVELIKAAFGLLDQATGLRTTVAAHSRGIQITIYFHTRE